MSRLLQQMRANNRLLRNMNNKMGNMPLGTQSLRGIDYIDLEDEYQNSNGDVDKLAEKIYQQKLQTLDLYGNTDKYMITTPQERHNLNLFKEARLVESAMEDKIINYVAAILDPEYNYNTGIMVKQPNLLNPPSVSIPIKTLTTIKSETESSICVAWNPALFCTKNDLLNLSLGTRGGNKVTPNRICSVLYALPENVGTESYIAADAWGAKVKCVPDNLPEVGVSKARLVSAKIKISFRGSVLNQGGTIMGAATFQGPPGVIVETDNREYVYKNGQEGAIATWADLFRPVLGDQFNDNNQCPFEEKVLSNGIWAKNVNITKDASGITAIFIPTDPMDEIFYKPGTYYGEPIAKDDTIQNSKGATTMLSSDKGAKLSYLFNIQGLSAQNSNPITIETYQTWEVLPTNLSASSLRNSANNMSSHQMIEKIKVLLQEYFNRSTGIHTNKPNSLSGLFDLLKKAAVGAWKAITS
jgi:hypothetical protein